MLDAVVHPEAAPVAPIARVAGWRGAVRVLRRRPASVLGLIGVVVVLTGAIVGPVVWPHDPFEQNTAIGLRPPIWVAGASPDHFLGTDALGRDVASRLLHGARNSLLISSLAALLGSLLGLAIGLVSGFLGGRVDTVLMRLGDVQLAFPFVLLAIAILGTSPNRTLLHLILVLGIPSWIIYARVVRSRVLAEKGKDYVTAARAVGASAPRRVLRYILPNVWQIVPVIALLDIGFLVIIESMLSFLGLGLAPPTPSWGSILAEGKQFMIVTPWLPILPGLAILLTVLSINLTADGLADLFDPKLARTGFRRFPLHSPVQSESGDAAPLLRVRDLTTEFPLEDRVVRAVRGVSFDLARGEALGIVGESGSGKSVTGLSIIQLLDSPGRVTSGQILFDGRDVTRIGNREMASLRGKRIGMIPQNPTAALNPVMTIGSQLRETLRRHRGPTGASVRTTARNSLLDVGIGDPERVLRAYSFQLSGGMNQRAMIALAMAPRPDLLIADEPTTALDVTTQAEILGRLEAIKRDYGTSIILITHDIALVAQFADVIVVMYAGQVAEIGPPDAVIHNPQHPYTEALLSSVPRAEVPAGARLRAIPGDPPDPAAVPSGCPFAARCPFVMAVCREVNPPRFVVGPNHESACHLRAPAAVEVA